VIGRDPRGSLPKADYEHVRTEIIKRLTPLVDPRTGDRAVAAVHRREEIFAGEYLGSAPDLIVEWDRFRYMPSEEVAATSSVFGTRTREYMSWPTSGSHRPEGLLIASGGSVRRGALERPIELIDLAPTWLALLNCPASPLMEGKAVNEVLKSVSAHQAQ
jgi:predicted AlkP superfamily phosphohydrolase/phosphomutase